MEKLWSFMKSVQAINLRLYTPFEPINIVFPIEEYWNGRNESTLESSSIEING
jgi:hypothetical protein